MCCEVGSQVSCRQQNSLSAMANGKPDGMLAPSDPCIAISRDTYSTPTQPRRCKRNKQIASSCEGTSKKRNHESREALPPSRLGVCESEFEEEEAKSGLASPVVAARLSSGLVIAVHDFFGGLKVSRSIGRAGSKHRSDINASFQKNSNRF